MAKRMIETVLLATLLCAASQGWSQSGSKQGKTPTLDQTLKWLQSLPEMTGQVWQGKDTNMYKKLTVKDLQTLNEVQIGGHVKGQKAHVNLPADDYRYLTALPALEKCNFLENEMDDKALVHIGKISTLKEIRFAASTFTGAGFQHLANLKNLELLEMYGCKKVDDAAVPHLCKLTSLKTLTLGGNNITAQGVAAIKKAIPECAITVR